MKGVKRRFANVRNIALFISIFMFISLFSNITVKADELENGEVNPVVSEQAELQSNEEFDTENELLIPEETTDYDDAQNDEVTSADLTGSGEELSEESKEELPTAEEANKQEEFFQEEILEEEIFEDEKEAEGAITEEEEEVINDMEFFNYSNDIFINNLSYDCLFFKVLIIWVENWSRCIKIAKNSSEIGIIESKREVIINLSWIL